MNTTGLSGKRLCFCFCVCGVFLFKVDVLKVFRVRERDCNMIDQSLVIFSFNLDV